MINGLGTVQDARKGQTNKDLVATWKKNFLHKYRVKITDTNVRKAEGRLIDKEVVGGTRDEAVNGRRLKTSYKSMKLFHQLRYVAARKILVTDLSEAPALRYIAEWVFDPDENKYIESRVFIPTKDGEIDYTATEAYEQELQQLMLINGIA